MSENKFTPGPWWVSQIDDGAGNYGGIAIDATSPHKPGTMEVCEVWGTVRETHVDDMAHANARLIAAAPELYEALRDMLSGWKYIRDMHGDLYGVGWDRAQEKAESALAKARGES